MATSHALRAQLQDEVERQSKAIVSQSNATEDAQQVFLEMKGNLNNQARRSMGHRKMAGNRPGL
jgi:hypothetical protein